MMLSAVVLTKNEEKNIERCLKSLSFCDEIIIIDDYSTDKTIDLARKYNVKIVEHSLNDDFASQRNFGLKQASGEWVLFIDADEEVVKELAEEIKHKINDTPDIKITGYYIKRRDWWWGKELKHGEVKTLREIGLLRLMRKNSGKWEGRVHEEFKISGKTLLLNSFINHYPHPTVKVFLEEVNRYSSIRAKELIAQGKTGSILEIIFYPFGKFLLIYFIKLGFLDGPVGFAYAFFMGFHSFLVRAKAYQYSKLK
jgi:glycosyltransferase involved in cell wall biosynthesis